MQALLFPGQGSQTVGMVKELYLNHSYVKDLFNLADETLGFKLSDIILNGPENKLTLTEHAQPALVTASTAILEVHKQEHNIDIPANFNFVAGHSLGEYSALVAAKALSFKDAVKLVHTRGLAMQSSVPKGEGGMAAIIGLSIEEIENCLPNDNSCVVAMITAMDKL